MKLNVFSFKAYGKYGGGMAVVAANSQEEAERLAAPLDTIWSTKFDAPYEVEILPVCYDGEPKVLSWFATGE